MEDGLVLTLDPDGKKVCSLNPCCSGRWSRTALNVVLSGAKIKS